MINIILLLIIIAMVVHICNIPRKIEVIFNYKQDYLKVMYMQYLATVAYKHKLIKEWEYNYSMCTERHIRSIEVESQNVDMDIKYLEEIIKNNNIGVDVNEYNLFIRRYFTKR